MKIDSRSSCPVQHGNSIANLAASFAGALGASTSAPAGPLSGEHSGLADQLSDRALVVFLLLDGVGANQIATHLPGGALANDQRAVLSSVFPSSTAPAITSLMSGACVGDHAIPGWHLQERAAQSPARPLPMDLRDRPGEPAPASVHQWMPWSKRANARYTAIQPAVIVNSVYSTYCIPDAQRYGYEGFRQIPEIFDAVVRDGGQSPHFCYIYISDFDSTSHHYGWTSPQAERCIKALDEVYEQLADRVTALGGAILAVSDHGFVDIDSDKQVWLNDFPQLYQFFEAPLSGEPRAAICHVRAEQCDEFFELASAQLASICTVRHTDDLINEKWFGTTPDADQRYRFGTHWLIPHDGYAVLDQLDSEKRIRLIGMHGGISDSEMQVPLVVRV